MKTPEVCKGCAKWEKFKDKCWVYWEHKKVCTLHTDEWNNFIL